MVVSNYTLHGVVSCAQHITLIEVLPTTTALSFSYIITRVAPHCVNTLRILHAAYDATLSLSLSLSYIITRVAPHCVNTLRILHAAYDATNISLSLSLSLSLSH